MSKERFLTWRSGAGLVVANMIGAGVLLSTGFMAQDMGPAPILFAWVMGTAIALCGVWAYGGVVMAVTESGGEYRFLSKLLHPFVGYLAGWGSLVLGFSAPIAIDAAAMGHFLNTLVEGPDPRITGAVVILAFTAVHLLPARFAVGGQNLLVVAKLLFLIGFVAAALLIGAKAMPTWQPPNGDGSWPWERIIANQFWIAFAFSGWNAAAYAAGEFKDPKRNVPLAMLAGCGSVAVLYLLINWVFVANLMPAQAAAVFGYEESRVTLGHLIGVQLFGAGGGKLMSAFVILAFGSAISAMTLIGPRVYSAMARDGFLPEIFAVEDGEVPLAAVVLQGSVAMLLLYTHSLLEAVQAASAFLMLFTAATGLALFRVASVLPGAEPPSRSRRVAAVLFAVAVALILWTGVQASSKLLWSLAGVVALAYGGYWITQRQRRS